MTNNLLITAFPYFNDQDHDLITSIQHQYLDEEYCLLPLHITLLSAQSDKPIDFCQKKLKHDFFNFPQALRIRTALAVPPLGQHEGWYAFLVFDEGMSSLLEAHTQLKQLSLWESYEEPMPFIPHITVGKFSEKEKCIQAVTEINHQLTTLTTYISTVKLLEKNQISNNYDGITCWSKT